MPKLEHSFRGYRQLFLVGSGCQPCGRYGSHVSLHVMSQQ